MIQETSCQLKSERNFENDPPQVEEFYSPIFLGGEHCICYNKTTCISMSQLHVEVRRQGWAPTLGSTFVQGFPYWGVPLDSQKFAHSPTWKNTPPPLNFYFPPPKVNYPSPLPQCCNLTLAWWFWATKVCLQASKISKICLFGRPNGWATSWKVNFENYSRYSLIKFYQFLLI